MKSTAHAHRTWPLLLAGLLALLLLCTAGAQDAGAIGADLRRSTSAKLQDLVLGDPIKLLESWMVFLNGTALRSSLLGLAGVVAVAGFLISVWKGVLAENFGAIRGAFANIVVSGMLLAVCFNFGQGGATFGRASNIPFSISAVAFGQYARSYDWARTTFTRGLDAKIAEAEGGMYAMLSQVVATAGLAVAPQALKVGWAGLKGAAFAARGSRLAAGLSAGGAAGKTFAGKAAGTIGGDLFAKLRTSMVALQYLMLGMAFVVLITGFLVLICVYLMPLAIAAINLGNPSWLWRFTGTIVGCWFAVMFVPLATVIAIDQAFVRPAQAMQFYSDQLEIERTRAITEANGVTEGVRQAGNAQADLCMQSVGASEANVDSAECQDLKSGNWFERGLGKAVDILTQRLGFLSDLVNGAINTVNRMAIAVAFSAIGLIIGISLLIGLPALFTGLFSGIAASMGMSNLGGGQSR